MKNKDIKMSFFCFSHMVSCIIFIWDKGLGGKGERRKRKEEGKGREKWYLNYKCNFGSAISQCKLNYLKERKSKKRVKIIFSVHKTQVLVVAQNQKDNFLLN